uniref:NTF2-related export protein n=1 Tax=Romanomermis culicivorax TaxID=13658 RepID=A0A915K6K0_ROMCU
MAFEQVGQQFLAYYYSKFDVSEGSERSAGLSPLYDDQNSFLTFEGACIQGKVAILEKYSSLPIKRILRKITKTDCQPMGVDSVLVTTFGQLKTDDDPPQSYIQTFVLKQTPDGRSYYIANEIFRLIIHDSM